VSRYEVEFLRIPLASWELLVQPVEAMKSGTYSVACMYTIQFNCSLSPRSECVACIFMGREHAQVGFMILTDLCSRLVRVAMSTVTISLL